MNLRQTTEPGVQNAKQKQANNHKSFNMLLGQIVGNWVRNHDT